jgi:peptide-methionine (S)-S-oxide reductase
MRMKGHLVETATFAAGCFWGVEETFTKSGKILSSLVGYTGGQTPNPTYEQVCTGMTGHAEAVQLTFDPTKTSFQELLTIFWQSHNPTKLNQQGPDSGTQYRSAIFYHSPEQHDAALASKENMEELKRWPSPIVTQISPAGPFFPAEEYHQQYIQKNRSAFCHRL